MPKKKDEIVLDRDENKMLDDAFNEWLRGEHKPPEPEENEGEQ